MTKLNPRALHSLARDRLACAPDSRKLVLFHTGLLLLLNLTGSALSLYLQDQIGNTGGLSGLGTRTFLQTLQTLLSYGTMFFTPFWNAGFVLVAIRWATDGAPQPRDLWSGFRRFTAVLSYWLLLVFGLFLVAQACLYISSFLFALTPYAQPLMELAEPIVSSGSMEAMETLPMDAIIQAGAPMLIIFAVLMIVIVVIAQYYLRLTTYFIMDPPGAGGVRAALSSFKAMGGNVLQMVKLDLHFWWFYVLEAALTVILYLDALLPALGITLPVDSTYAYFITLILYCVLQLALHLWKKAEVDTTYALAYRQIVTPPESEINPVF